MFLCTHTHTNSAKTGAFVVTGASDRTLKRYELDGTHLKNMVATSQSDSQHAQHAQQQQDLTDSTSDAHTNQQQQQQQHAIQMHTAKHSVMAHTKVHTICHIRGHVFRVGT